MAGTIGNNNATGNSGGKSLNDRKLASTVRSLALNKIQKHLEIGDEAGNKELYKAILIKLAGSVLPRLNEMTGEDGEKLTITISREIAEKNNIKTSDTSPSTSNNSQEQPQIQSS